MALVSTGKLLCANVIDYDIQNIFSKMLESPLCNHWYAWLLFGTLSKITTEGIIFFLGLWLMYQNENDCSSIINITVKYELPSLPVFLSHPHQHSSLPPEVRPHLGWDCNRLRFLVMAVSVSVSVEVPSVNSGTSNQ